jgi:transcriptional regulator of arginine metabolism
VRPAPGRVASTTADGASPTPSRLWSARPPREHRRRRRRAILAAIEERSIATQEQLVAALAAAGFDVSQASVSRDIAALRLVKVDGRWSAPPREPASADPNESRIAGRLLSVAAAGDHLLVLKTPAGEAQGVALALDRLAPPASSARSLATTPSSSRWPARRQGSGWPSACAR